MTRFPLIFHEILSSDVSRLVSLLYTSLSIAESSSHSIISGLWYNHSHQFPSWRFVSLQSICFFSWLFFLAGGLMTSLCMPSLCMFVDVTGSIVYAMQDEVWTNTPSLKCPTCACVPVWVTRDAYFACASSLRTFPVLLNFYTYTCIRMELFH